jgi:hypothetical protein
MLGFPSLSYVPTTQTGDGTIKVPAPMDRFIIYQKTMGLLLLLTLISKNEVTFLGMLNLDSPPRP